MAVPGAFYDREAEPRGWVVDQPDARSAAVICRLFPELQDEYPDLTVLRDSLMKDARPFDNATPAGLSIDVPAIEAILKAGTCPRCPALPSDYWRKLDAIPPPPGRGDPACPICKGALHGGFYPFQRIDLGYIAAVLREHGSAEIAWDRGMGKTLAAACMIDTLSADRAMVVAPNTAKQAVWEDELLRFLPDRDVFVMPNGKPEKREKLIQHIATTHHPFTLVCHYEALDLIAKTRSAGQGWKRSKGFDLIAADESHRLTRTTTKMHRALMKVPTDGKLSLTGSMIQNHPEEFYGRLRWLFPKQYKSKWNDWNNRFLDYVESGYGKVLVGPKLDRLDAMRQELGVFTVYRRKLDELDLPPRQEENVLLDLTDEQRRAYNQLRDEYVATLETEQQIVALRPVALLTRLRQLAAGLDLFDGTLRDSTKMDWTVERVQDRPDDAFVCFSWFKPGAYALASRLADVGEDSFVCTGDTTHKQRRERIKAFQAGEGGRVFIGTISTLGESVNLHRANAGIFIDRSFNPAQNEQAADRYWRIGQLRPVTTTNLIARDTVDQSNLLPNLNNKESIRRLMLGGV
jgi:SNF2 family DNA or RNA helicase